MPFSGAFCDIPPVVANYTAKGEHGKLGDIDCYFTGKKGSKRGIFVNYDAFRYHPNVFQICDILGSLGFYVLVPDLFRGKPLTVDDLGNPKVMEEFMGNCGSWKVSKAYYIQGIEYLRNSGATSVGILGFCWGGKVALTGLQELDGLVGGAIVHPAMVTSDDFGKVKTPLMAMPFNDKDMEMFKRGFAELKTKPFGTQCRLESFVDVIYGFCGPRGDWTDPTIAKRVNDAIQLLATFFNDIMPN
ncbi:hypothetical protein GGI13_004915 [Coemansia sp. RSA 455]|nr:hypothetical protein GGI13_004915 [Coemansia sp. RSA 455]